MTDDQQDQEGGEYAMEEDYEDEEDRLIAQGGMGIPLDEVRVSSQPVYMIKGGFPELIFDLDTEWTPSATATCHGQTSSRSKMSSPRFR